MMIAIHIVLMAAAMFLFADMIFTSVAAGKDVGTNQYHWCNLRGGVYAIGAILAIGFLGLLIK